MKSRAFAFEFIFRIFLLCAFFLCAQLARATVYVYIYAEWTNTLYEYTGSSTDSETIISEISAGNNCTENNSSYDFGGSSTATTYIGEADTIIVASGATLSLNYAWQNNGTIINYGTVNSTNGSLTNGNTIENHGTFTVAMTFTNESNVTNTGTMTLSGAVTNSGTLTNSGTINVSQAFENEGTITNSGTFTSTNTITNSGTITNTSEMSCSNFVNETSGNVTNSGTFTANQELKNSGTYKNTGTTIAQNNIYNYSGSTMTNSGTGTIKTNSGNAINNSDGSNFSDETLGHTYYWRGGAGDSLWTTSSNWQNKNGTVFTSGYPGADDGDVAIFDYATGAITVYGFDAVGDVTVQNALIYLVTLASSATAAEDHSSANIEIQGGSSNTTQGAVQFSFPVGTTVGSISVTNSGVFQPRTGGFEIKGDFYIDSTSSAYFVNSFTVDGKFINEGGTSQTGTGYTYKFHGDVENSGTLGFGSNNSVFGDDTGDTIVNTGKINLGTGTATFGGTTTNSGELKLGSGLTTFDGDVTNTYTITAGTGNIVANASFVNNGGEITFSSGTVTVNGAAENSGTGAIITCGTGAVVFNGTFKNLNPATFNAADDTNGSVTFNGKTTNNYIFDCNKSTVTFNGDFKAGSGSYFIASSGDTMFFAKADFSEMTAGDFDASGGYVHLFGSGTMKTCSGQAFSTLRFGGDVTINASAGDFSATALRMQGKDSDENALITSSFTAKITGGNKVTATNTIVTRVNTDTDGIIGTLELDCDLSTTNFTMYEGTVLIVDSSRSLQMTNTPSVSGNTSYSCAIAVLGALDASSLDLTLPYTDVFCFGTIKAKSIAMTGNNATKPYNAASNSKANTYGYTGTGHIFYNTGTVTVTGAITQTADITNEATGVITAAGITANSITNAGSITSSAAVSADKTIKNSNSFTVTGNVNANDIENTKLFDITGSITATDSIKNTTSDGKINLHGGSSTLSFGTYTGDGNESVLTYGNAIKSTSATSATIGTLTIAGATDCTGFTDGLTIEKSLLVYYALTTDGSFTVNGTGGAYSNLNANITASGAQTYSETVTIGGNAMLVSGEKKISFEDVQINSGYTLAFGSATTDAYDVTVSGNWKNANTSGGLTANNSTVTFTGEAKTIEGSQTFYKATFEADTTISGANTFTDFVAEKGGIALTVNAEQTVSGNLTLTGEAGSLLKIAGTSYFSADTAKFTGTYLSIDDSVEILKSGTLTAGAFAVTNSKGASSAATYAVLYGHGWKLSDMPFTWTGAVSDEWNNVENWDLGIAPTNTTANDDEVIIPDGLQNYYPIVSAAYYVKSLTIGTEDEATHNAKITLSSTNALSVTDTLTNYGTIVYQGSGRITDGTTALNDTAHSGTVEYSGTGLTVTDFGATDYANLTISGSATANADIAVSGNCAISGSATFNAALTVAGELNLSRSGTIAFNATTNSGQVTSANTFACTMTGGTLKFGRTSDTTTSFKVSSGGISIPSTVATLTIGGTMDTSADGGEQIYNCAVKLKGTPTTFNAGIGTVTFAGTVSNDSDILSQGLTVTGNAVFKANATSSGDILVSGTTRVEGNSITLNAKGSAGTNGVLRLTGAVTLAATATTFYSIDKMTFGSTIDGATENANAVTFSAKNTILGITTKKAITFTGAVGSTVPLGKVTVNYGEATANEAFNSQSLEITSNAKFTPAASSIVTLAGDFTNNGTFTHNNSTVVFTDDATISGNTTFYNLTADTGGKTLTVSDTQTVSNKLTLKGEEDNSLTLAGTGTFIVSTANFTGEYLSIGSSVKIRETSTIIAGAFSVASSAPDTANGATVASCYANGWKFSVLLITWTGATSTDWATESNWDLGIVPGSTNLEDAKVIIPDSLSNYPLTSSAYTVGSITVGTEDATTHDATLTLGANITATDTITNYATLKLASFDVTASEIKNYGTLNLAGSQTITGTKTNGANSSVEYFGTGLTSLPWGASYVHLSFTTGATGSITDSLTVSGATTIANGSTNTLSLTSNANAFSGGVVLNGAGTISLNANSTISLKKASDTTKMTCNSLALYNSATTNSALEAADITIGTSTTLSVGGAISTTNTLTNNGTLALGTNALSFGSYTGTSDTITATAGGSITQSGSTASAISSLSLAPSGTAVFTLNGGSGLTLTTATYNATPLKTTGTVNTAVTTGTDKIGALTVSSGTTTLGGNTAITSVSIASGATLSAGNTATDAYTLTISGNWTNSNTSGGFAANNSTVQFTGYATITGATTFYNVACSTGGITLTVNGTQSISSALTLSGEEDNLLSLAGSGQFVAILSEYSGNYLSIGSKITIAENAGNVVSGTFEAKNSQPSSASEYSVVYKNGWKIVNKLAIIKTIAPVGSNSIYIAFNSMLYSPDGALLTTATDISSVSSAFAVQKNGEDIYRATAAKIVENSNGESGIIITISGGRITLDDVKNADLAVTETSAVFFGEGGKMLSPLTHCVSHVVAGAVEVLYAKPNLSEDLPDAYTARNFSKDSGEDGKVLFSAEDGYSVTVSTHIATEADKNGNLNFTLDFLDSLLMYAKKSSPKSSDTSLYENVPSIAGKTAGASYLRNFTLDFASSALSGAQAGDAVEFMFVLADSSGNVFTRSLDGNKNTSLPVLRQTDSSDPRTLDTWRFTLSDIKAQRGGVTILNNVINSLQKEQTTIVVDTPSSGTLSVYVMTLDGRIVRMLSKSRVKAGKHYFTWNGTNGAGKSVARGLYFVRVLSSDIDETRKVLVIKE